MRRHTYIYRKAAYKIYVKKTVHTEKMVYSAIGIEKNRRQSKEYKNSLGTSLLHTHPVLLSHPSFPMERCKA